MGKKNSSLPSEAHLSLAPHPALSLTASTAPSIVDTHTHLLSTYTAYRTKYPHARFHTVHDFVRGLYQGHRVAAIVDVWCEAPVQAEWRALADSALTEEGRREGWGGLEYWFVMGVHPHEAALTRSRTPYAMAHPRCVGWLDYHYDNAPREIQQDVFTRQLQHAVCLRKPLTIHTREAEGDTERMLKEHVPTDHHIHVHCYTDSPEWAARMLAHFPNLFIGITGVITYATNLNTAAVVRQLATESSTSLRILLETDAPFMVPSNLYATLKEVKGRLPLSHSAMIPWTAEYVASVASEHSGVWTVDRVMQEARRNAQTMYGV